MPTLTPEQEALKQAALNVKRTRQLTPHEYELACDQFEHFATPEAVAALLAQLEAAPSEPKPDFSKFATLAEYTDAFAQRKSAPDALARQIEEAKGGK